MGGGRRGRRLDPGLLKNYRDAKTKRDNLLLNDVQIHVLSKYAQDSSRRQDIIHPSEMAKADWCPRQTYYRLAGVVPTEDDASFSMRTETIFQEGHDIHNKWQTWLTEMGRMWGLWKCPLCGSSEQGVGPTYCSEHGTYDVPRRYAEVPLDAEDEWMIAGHADGAVLDINALLEVKSIGLGTLRMEEPELVKKYTKTTEDGKKVVDLDSLFRNIRRPLASHIRQTQIYLAICRLREMPIDKVVFLYESKANQEVKEFVVKYNESISAPLIDTALDIKYALQKGRTPNRRSDLTPTSSPCKNCVFLTHCYQEDPLVETSRAEAVRGDRPADAGSKSRRRRGAAAPGSGDSSPTRRARSTAARGSDRPGRRRADEPVQQADPVGGVHGSATSSGGGRRVVRRRGSEAD